MPLQYLFFGHSPPASRPETKREKGRIESAHILRPRVHSHAQAHVQREAVQQRPARDGEVGGSRRVGARSATKCMQIQSSTHICSSSSLAAVELRGSSRCSSCAAPAGPAGPAESGGAGVASGGGTGILRGKIFAASFIPKISQEMQSVPRRPSLLESLPCQNSTHLLCCLVQTQQHISNTSLLRRCVEFVQGKDQMC